MKIKDLGKCTIYPDTLLFLCPFCKKRGHVCKAEIDLGAVHCLNCNKSIIIEE